MSANTAPLLDREASWRVIEQQRLAIADVLAELTPAEWELPSLCARWRIRDVAAHLALTPHPPSLGALLVAGLRANGNYNRLIDDLTVRAADRPPAELVATLRAHASSRKLPGPTNYRNILFDTMVHGQDIAIPLGRTIELPVDAAATGASTATEIGWPVWKKRRLDGFALRATDIDWSYGEGVEIRGPIKALLLVVTGRPAGLARVTGDGVPALTARLLADTAVPK
ncbi:maleylpyruvate isomerase family mycothiol-dependent enzyme [Nocardia sp. XZ_19_369]|uniref:maleylpyruvate isomerase family mycothiol-dependent enzyme n=1 Tax=Nocardia sp. XZ_19_369 TaxID=2769487 RepID=UPI00188FB45D|nr:maleylpyruvate isomerase family mycothiol-dependent enzyme [Nocardia sp. XZ_19_369]